MVEYLDWRSGLTAMQRLTGFPTAIAATMLARGDASRAGAVPPEEAFAPGPFLAALRERGITINET